MDQDWNAPGWDFVLGSQDPNIRYKAAKNGWLTKNQSLTTPFNQTRTESINLRANIEPSTDFKIQLDVKKETNSTFQSIFRYDTIPGTHGQEYDFQDLSPSRGGSYRISTVNIGTAFNGSNDKIVSSVFQDFERNLETIRERFNIIAHQDPTVTEEYDTAAQDILIPAFIAAYTGSDAKRVSLSPFPKTPMPNWRIDYTGLNKIGIFKDIFSSITLSHAYQASYSVVNYQNSLEFSDGGDVRGLQLDRPVTDYNVSYFGRVITGSTAAGTENRLVPVYIISQVLISEQFSPLIGINMRTKGRLSANFQYKTKRDLALTVSNAQVTELSTKDFSFELGYTKNNMKLPFKSQGRTVVLKNDVTFRMNVSVADTKTIQRKIYETNIITNGNINFQLRPNISYVVNQKLNIQLYFERTINEPLVSNSYRRATTRFGTQIRFSLAQ
jgi:cell surface protein SprA